MKNVLVERPGMPQRLFPMVLRALGLAAVLALPLLGSASPALADPADVNWSADFGAPGLEGYVRCSVNWNGTLVVGGELTHAGGWAVTNVVAWNGTRFTTLGNGLNGTVTALAVVGATLYAAGDFTGSGATPLPHVARWTGSAWVAVGAGAPDDTYDLRLAVDGSSLLLLGSFTEVGAPPVAASCIASWNGSAWSAVGNFSGFEHLNAAARVGSRLYVGGNSLHYWDGVDWTYDLGAGGEIKSLAEFGGDLYLCGDFSSVDFGNLVANGIARYDGTAFATLADVAPDGQFQQIGIDGGQLLAIGSFDSTPGPRTAQWDGTSWTPGPFGPLGELRTFTRAGGDLFLAGSMYYYYGPGGLNGVDNILAWDGTQFRTLGAGSGVLNSGYVTGLGTYDNRLIATGSLNQIGDQSFVNGIAAWDGTRWSKLGTGLNEAFSNPSGKHLTTWNNRLVVTGYFTGAGAVNSQSIVAWDGTAWQGFDGGFANQGAQVVSYNSELIASSSAGNLGLNPGTGTTLGHVARWTGAHWQTIGTVTPIFSLGDHGMTVWNGKLIYGGSFSHVNGVPASNVAQWDGTTWSPLGNGFNNFVYALAVHNGELYAAGFFTASGATPLPGFMARWNGSAWVAVGTGLDGVPTGLTSADGKLFATGGFSMAGGNPAYRVAAWDGTNWSALGSGLAEGPTGNHQSSVSLAAWNGGLFAGGFFNTAGDKSSRCIARWQLTDVAAVETPAIEPGLGLAPPSQNPASGRVSLAFRLPEAGEVSAAVFDARGRLVQTLLDTSLAPGAHALTWRGRDDAGQAVGSGIYWVRLSTAAGHSSRKVVWLR